MWRSRLPAIVDLNMIQLSDWVVHEPCVVDPSCHMVKMLMSWLVVKVERKVTDDLNRIKT